MPKNDVKMNVDSQLTTVTLCGTKFYKHKNCHVHVLLFEVNRDN